MAHIERRHRIILAGAIDRVFPLFTPKGERLWVDEWDPEYLHPESGETCEGMVFTTRHGGETTLWSCIAWRPDAHHVRYARVTPESRFGFVDVRCREIAAGRTEATVSYAITALNAAGSAYLANLTGPAFAPMIDGWRTLIDEWLRTHPAGVA